jgi:hypothetical protein
MTFVPSLLGARVALVCPHESERRMINLSYDGDNIK